MIPAAVASPEDQALAAALSEFGDRLFDPWWRLTSGLYKIITKGESGDGAVQPFVPNLIQADFLATLHTREEVTKCRQVGITTAISVYFLDHTVWNADQRCAQIAQDLDKVAEIFRDKVRFAYDSLPEPLRKAFPLKKANETLLHFGHNNSIIFVDTSTRGGTINRLHVSEFGKISVQRPQAAKEIVTGAFPSVPKNGVIIIESTAEGQEGEFHKIAHLAEARTRDPAPLRPMEWKHRFYAWWEYDKYEIDPAGVPITARDHQYFDEVEAKIVLAGKRAPGFKLPLRKRAWYVDFRRNQLANDSVKMLQEMPSTFEEAWLRSPEGVFFAEQLSLAVAERRVRPLPHASYTPVNTFWDIGSSDGTAIWLHQFVHPEHRLIRHIEGWFQGYEFYVRALDRIAEAAPAGFVWGTHYLPHDAAHKRQQTHRVASPLDMLQELKPTWKFEIVPPVAEKEHARSALRRIFPQLWFNVDEAVPSSDDDPQAPDCRRGIRHLWNYRKKKNLQTGGWSDEEVKNEAREAADALMQLAQAFDSLNPTVRAGQRPNRDATRRRMP